MLLFSSKRKNHIPNNKVLLFKNTLQQLEESLWYMILSLRITSYHQ